MSIRPMLEIFWADVLVILVDLVITGRKLNKTSLSNLQSVGAWCVSENRYSYHQGYIFHIFSLPIDDLLELHLKESIDTTN